MDLVRYATVSITAVAVLFLSSCSKDEKFPVRTYPLGEKVALGNLVYTAFETRWLTQMGEDPVPRLPQNRFFLVRVNISNSGGTETSSPALSIVDDSGKTYEELSNGENAPQWIGYLRQIKPAEAAQGNLLFDAPPRHYKLRITDETGERTALVDIPLSFNAETPEAVRPGDKPAPGDVFKK
jgi:hypothetical protein